MAKRSKPSQAATKIPHPGKGGRKKGQPVSEYEEVKVKLNLSLTKTAKDKLFELARNYGLPLSDVFEQLSRSDNCLKFIQEELDLKGRAEKVRQLRLEAKSRKS